MSAEGEHLLAVIETEEKDEKEANAAPEEPDVVKSYLQLCTPHLTRAMNRDL